MKESYSERLAIYTGPESCGVLREDNVSVPIEAVLHCYLLIEASWNLRERRETSRVYFGKVRGASCAVRVLR
jgi:hypothetical protein